MGGRSLSPGGRLAGAGGLVLLAALFEKWYGFSATITVNGIDLHGLASANFSGWHALTYGRWILLSTGLLAIARALAQAGVRQGGAPGTVLGALGVLCAAWILFRMVSHPAAHLSLRYGIFVALIGAGLLISGAWRLAQEERFAAAAARPSSKRPVGG
ncbi:MAG: hypothetical protein NVSMB51_10870 [Solirubrobacteraceae bacterium]